MKIDFLITSDIHGFILPFAYHDRKEINQGLLKLIETMKPYRGDNCFVIDNGDLLQGSPFSDYYHDKKDPFSFCMNSFYDFFNPGNHDFNYGVDHLLDFLASFSGACLCGNVFYKGKRLGEEYVIKEIDGYKVGFVGCISKVSLMAEKEEILKDLLILEPYDHIKDTLSKMDCDLKVVVYHGGLEKDREGNETEKITGENEAYRMCEGLDIDIMISGHQHRSLALQIGKTLLCQCGNNGKEFAYISYDTELRNGIVELIPCGNKIDPVLYEHYLKLDEDVEVWLDSPLGEVDLDLSIKDEFEARIHKSPLISFINQIQMEVSGSDLASCALFSGSVGFGKKITMRDLVSTYIYPNTLVKVKTDGKRLKEYLEICASYFDLDDGEIVVSSAWLDPVPKHFNYDMLDGADYVIDLKRPVGKRIVSLSVDGKEVCDEDVFSLAVSNYRASGVSDFSLFKDLVHLYESGEDMVEIISARLREEKIFKVKHHDNIKLIK